MTTDTTTAEMIPSGVYIFYKCKDEVNKMLPDANDPPFANFMIDIKCDRSVRYTPQIAYRVAVCPRENLPYIQIYPITNSYSKALFSSTLVSSMPSIGSMAV